MYGNLVPYFPVATRTRSCLKKAEKLTSLPDLILQQVQDEGKLVDRELEISNALIEFEQHISTDLPDSVPISKFSLYSTLHVTLNFGFLTLINIRFAESGVVSDTEESSLDIVGG